MRRILGAVGCLMLTLALSGGARSQEGASVSSMEVEGSAPLGADANAAKRAAIDDARWRAVHDALGHGVELSQVGRYVKSYRIIDSRVEGGRCLVRLDVSVLTAPDPDRAAEKLRWSGNPRLMVVVPETLLGRPRVPDPAGETELIHCLVSAGFRVLDASQISVIRYTPEMGRIIKEADTGAMRALGAKYHCDVLVVGEAFAEEVTENGVPGFRSAEARVEVKAFLADTGEILAADGATAPGAALGTFIAGKTALQNAARLLARQVVPPLRAAITDKSRVIAVRVTGLASPGQLDQVEAELKQIAGIEAVERRGSDLPAGAATLEIEGYLTTTQFQRELLPLRTPKLEALRSTGQEMELVVAGSPPKAAGHAARPQRVAGRLADRSGRRTGTPIARSFLPPAPAPIKIDRRAR